MSPNAGDAALPYHTIYSASKAALQSYCDGLRYEVEPLGIRVAYLQNGGIKSGAKSSFLPGAEPINAYASPRNRAIDAFHRLQDKGPEPHAVGRAVADAIEAKWIKPVIRVDGFSKLLAFLQRVMPSWFSDISLKR